MADIQVDVEYKGKDDEIAIISARGFIDTTTAPDLEKKLEEQLALNKYKIIVNLESIDYVSSAGWGVFVSEIREIRENNGDLVLVNMSSDVFDVYELMEFSSILKSFESIEDAILSLSGKGSVKETRRPLKPQATAQEQEKRFTSPPPATEKKEDPAPSPASAKPAGSEIESPASTDLGKKIISVIVDNPYYDLKEIIKALREPQYGGLKVGGGAVKKELKEMDLLDRQKRFELAIKNKK
jgi:anti-sigma B factor antagonist